MRYIFDQDLHIHSYLSSCSKDPLQTNEFILQYAKENGLRHIVLTNHFWDERVEGASEWYKAQNYAHLKEALPLPQDPEVVFHFGCELEMDKDCRLSAKSDLFDQFDFIIVPTTHLHMVGFTIREEDTELGALRDFYLRRLDTVLSMDLPFYKVGIPHLTISLLAQRDWQKHIALIDSISDDVYRSYFLRIAKLGAGVELNMSEYNRYMNEGGFDRFLRVFRLAKECGCKFYFASDAHHPVHFENMRARCENVIDLLGLEETDKFSPFAH